MISMTGTARPVESQGVSAVLGQNLRRSFEHTLLFTGQMFLILPGVGTVLVTEQPRCYRFDVVGDDQATVDTHVIRLETEILRHTAGQRIRFSWEKSSPIPVPFR